MIIKNSFQRSTREWIFQIIGITVAYYITGKLGNLFAIPPGYASTIFPPSGIALAAILLYGNRVFFGVLLGAFLFNYSLLEITHNVLEIFIAFFIASGASIQAIVGTYLIRRFTKFPQEFFTIKCILTFMFYGGIVSSLVNSTLSVSLLVFMGEMPIESFFINWVTWWSGDALGIMIFTPLMLIWLMPNALALSGKCLTITAPILIVFFLTAIAMFYEVKSHNDYLILKFEQESDQLNASLVSSINTNLFVLKTIQGFYRASEKVTTEAFRTFVATQGLDKASSIQTLGVADSILGVEDNLHGIQALGFNQRVLASERSALEKSIQQQGNPSFQITERDANKKLIRAGTRSEYYPVTIIEPLKGNESVLGYDIYSDDIRHTALDRSRDNDELAITAKITLVQEKSKQNGFLAFMPIYYANTAHETLEERRNNISALVTVVLRGGDIVKGALKNYKTDDIFYRLIDETAPMMDQLIFSNSEKEITPVVLQEKGIFGDKKVVFSSKVIPIGGRVWRFEIMPSPQYFSQHSSLTVWLILFTGMLFTILTIIAVLASAGRRVTLENLLNKVVESNQELVVVNEELITSNNQNEILYRQVNHMQKLESIGRMTSGIAHDFNNILACMMGYNDMNEYISDDITDEALKTELERNTKQINDAGKRAVALINKMLVYCRQDETYVNKTVQPTQDVIQDVSIMLRPALTSAIQLKIELDCTKDIQIDSEDLHQILTNLGINARDAMKKSGGVIIISLKIVSEKETYCMACAKVINGDFIELSMADNGTGIEPKIFPRLFDPFFTTKEQGEGTGLGLSTVSGSVHRANGHILIESNVTEPNRGTTFRLLFPLISNDQTIENSTISV